MRLWHAISWASLSVAVILLLFAVVVSLGPGHRLRIPLVNRDGTINRELFVASSEYELTRSLDNIEMVLQNQERHWEATRMADGLILLSWLFVIAAFMLRVLASQNQRLQLTGDAHDGE